MDKIPTSPGKRYRGVGKPEIDILDQLEIGDEIPYKNFISSSSEAEIAEGFARRNMDKTGDAAMLILESKNGKRIYQFADDPRELEFLHKSNSTWKLDKVLENTILNVNEHQIQGLPIIRGKRFFLIEQ